MKAVLKAKGVGHMFYFWLILQFAVCPSIFLIVYPTQCHRWGGDILESPINLTHMTLVSWKKPSTKKTLKQAQWKQCKLHKEKPQLACRFAPRTLLSQGLQHQPQCTPCWPFTARRTRSTKWKWASEILWIHVARPFSEHIFFFVLLCSVLHSYNKGNERMMTLDTSHS